MNLSSRKNGPCELATQTVCSACGTDITASDTCHLPVNGDGDRVMPQPVVGWRNVRGWWGRLLSHIRAGRKTRRKAAHRENKCACAEKKSTRRRLHCVNLTSMRVHRYMMAWNMAVSAQARPFFSPPQKRRDSSGAHRKECEQKTRAVSLSKLRPLVFSVKIEVYVRGGTNPP